MRHSMLALGVAFLPVGSALAAGDASLAGVRTALEQWVETRQLIARTQADWLSEKEMLEQTVALFERELATLAEQMTKAQTGSTQVDKERVALEAEKAELAEASAKAKEWATRLEARIGDLLKILPQPLRERMDPLIRLIPEDPAKTRLSGPERMRNVIGILNEVDKFNSAVSVESEMQKRPSGEEVQVKTLYVGLGQAYFVDKSGTIAGVGVPGADGWKWTERPEIAAAVQRAIAMYENKQPPAFVDLPFTLY